MAFVQTKARQIVALDLQPEWKKAFEETVLPQYQDEHSMAGLLRRFIKELIGCFSTERQLRDRGLLAPYQSMRTPDALLFALRRAEELRKESTIHDATTALPIESDNRSKRHKAS